MKKPTKKTTKTPRTTKEKGITAGMLRGLIPESPSGGVIVTEQTSQFIAGCWCAVRCISECFSSISLELYRKLPDGSRERAEDHTLYGLKTDFNGETSSLIARETAMVHLCLWGNAFFEITFDGGGNARELWLIHPQQVALKRDQGKLVYEVRDYEGAIRVLEPYQVVHLCGPMSQDGLLGANPIAAARQTLSNMLACNVYQGSLLENQARPSIMLSHPQKPSQAAVEMIRQTWSGVRNAGKVGILPEGMSVQPIGWSMHDMEFAELMKWGLEECARIWNVPLSRLRDMRRLTWSNYEQDSLSWLVDTIRPWCVRWEAELNRKLLPTSKFYFEHNIDVLMRADSTQRIDYITKCVSYGMLSANQANELLNLPKFEGGDEHMMLNTLVPYGTQPASFTPSSQNPNGGNPENQSGATDGNGNSNVPSIGSSE